MASYRQNRPVLFLKGPYNIPLQLVHTCSIFQGAMQHPSHNQYRFVLFLKGPCNTLLTFSTGMFYFSRDHTTPSYNQYRPVLSLKGPCNTLLTISTGLFYLTKGHTTPCSQLVQACSISQQTTHTHTFLQLLYNTILCLLNLHSYTKQMTPPTRVASFV